MALNGVIRQCVMFGSKTSKNIYDVSKVRLRLFLSVFMYFDEIYMLVLIKIDV